jgi:hypothetical protein
MVRSSPTIHQKTIREGWVLRRMRNGYELEQPGECKLSFPSWEWADWDRHRLVWTEAGCLKAAMIGSHQLKTVRTLYDFNTMLPPASRQKPK